MHATGTRVLLLAAAVGAGCTGPGRSTGPQESSGIAGAGIVLPPLDAAAHAPPPVHPPPSFLPIIPAPRVATTCAGAFAVGAAEIIVDDEPAARAIGLRLAEWVGLGASLVRAIPAGAPGPARAIVLRLDPLPRSDADRAWRDPSVTPPGDLDDESYTLDVAEDLAVIRARHPAGLFYGAQTLAQLAGLRPIGNRSTSATATRVVPCCHVVDSPSYRFRAMHLDTARHFFPRDVLERYVDLLAFYKLNVFHWHLTDDQGFRLEIRSHPELTQVGARRLEDGKEVAGSYTQDDVRAVVAYAKARFVTVIPEIEMPGHARAILASHPELSCTGKKQDVPATWGVFDDVLCAGNEGTFKLLADVLRETAELFPSRLVHLGGDEVPKTRWNACPKCRARMAREGLDAEQLQGAFLRRASAMLAASGRRPLAWDEALEGGLPKDAILVAWQNAKRGAAAASAGYDVVMAPSGTVYFNFGQSRVVTEPPEPGHRGFEPWTAVLGFDPRSATPDPVPSAHVLGGEGALWTEYVKTSDAIDTLLLPRLAALSEPLWHADATTFAPRFAVQRDMLDAGRVHYFVEPPQGLKPRSVFLDTATLDLVRAPLEADGLVRFTLDGSDPVASSPIAMGPIALRATTTASARVFLPGGRASEIVRGTFERATPRPSPPAAPEPGSLVKGVSYKYFEGAFKKLPLFANLTARQQGRMAALGFEPGFRREQFAVLFEAWVVAPQDGVYRFVARADDGVTVDVDGARVVDDDGEHAAHDAEGEIALARGPHTVRLGYFQGGGGKALSLACEGPGLPLGPCPLVRPISP